MVRCSALVGMNDVIRAEFDCLLFNNSLSIQVDNEAACPAAV